MAYTALDETDNYGITSSIVMTGDSLTENRGTLYTILEWLNIFLGPRTYVNRGIGGQTSSQIAARFGGIPIRMSITGDVLNGTSEVDITSISNYFLSTAATGAIKRSTGLLNGVPVIVTRKFTGSPAVSEPGNYTVRPAFGQTTVIPPNSLYIPHKSIDSEQDIHILWPGRNDVPNLATVPDLIDACISSLPRPRRILIPGVLNGRSEIIGTSFYNAVIAHNAIIQSRYPNNFVRTTPPTDADLSEIGYAKTGTDAADIANGTFPAGMRIDLDNVHLNDWGNKYVAWNIYKAIKSKPF